MTTGSLFWIVVFCLATLLFFVVAVVIAVMGIKDLRDLLKPLSSTSKT